MVMDKSCKYVNQFHLFCIDSANILCGTWAKSQARLPELNKQHLMLHAARHLRKPLFHRRYSLLSTGLINNLVLLITC